MDHNKRLAPKDIGQPYNFRHVGHIGWNPHGRWGVDNIDPQWKRLFEHLGITHKQLEDKENSTFIFNFVESNGGIENAIEELEANKIELPTMPITILPPSKPKPPPLPPRKPQRHNFRNNITADNNNNNSETTGNSKNMSAVRTSIYAEEHFSCPICLEIVENAVETGCCHQLFCEDCSKEIVNKPCPKCRFEPVVFNASHVARQFIGNLPVECPNTGCGVGTTRSNLKEHQQKCEFTLVDCSNNECRLKMFRSEIQRHLKICDYLKIPCLNNGCNLVFLRLRLSQHQEVCKFVMIKCPAPGCNFSGPGYSFSNHIGEVHYSNLIKYSKELFPME